MKNRLVACFFLISCFSAVRTRYFLQHVLPWITLNPRRLYVRNP